MTNSVALTATLRSIRAKLNLTQEQLAERLGVSFATVNRWEGGNSKPQKAAREVIATLARAAGIDEANGAAAPQGPAAEVTRRRRGKGVAAPTTKPMEQMLWHAACSIRGEKDAAKFKDYLLPLLFLKRLSDVFDDEIDRLAEEYGDRETALEIAEGDHSLLRFYLPTEARWAVISGREDFDWPAKDKPRDIGEHLTKAVRAVAKQNPSLSGVLDVVDFAAERNGERDINPAKLRGVVETFSDPRYRLGLADVQPDFLGRAYEYLLRKFAEGSGQSAGEFFTPTEVGFLMAHIMRPKPGEDCHDYACGSAGLLVKLQLVAREFDPTSKVPLKLTAQELQAESYAVAKMNAIIHDMQIELARGDTMINPKFRTPEGKIRTHDVVVANPMWNQPFAPDIFANDPFDRFRTTGGITTGKGDWAWLQHTLACLNEKGRAAVVLDTGAVTRGSGSKNDDKERNIRKWFVDRDLIDGVILLPDNLFYNTNAAGVILVFNKRKTAARKNRIVLLDASRRVKKGRPKNYIPEDSVRTLAAAFLKGEPVPGEIAVITTQQAQDADYSLSPSRWVEKKDTAEDADVGALLDALKELESEARSRAAKVASLLSPIADDLVGGSVDTASDARKDTDVGSIPCDWRVASLPEVCAMRSGGTPPKSDPTLWAGDFPWVSGKDLKSKRLGDSIDHITPEAAAEFSKVAPANSVLVLVRGMGLAKGFALSLIERDMAFNQDLKALVPSDGLLGTYLMYALTYAGQRMLRNVADAAHGTKRLSQDDLDNFKIPIPPIEEQKAIITLLDAVDRQLEVNRKTHEVLEDLSRALIQKLVTGEVRLVDDTAPESAS